MKIQNLDVCKHKTFVYKSLPREREKQATECNEKHSFHLATPKTSWRNIYNSISNAQNTIEI